MKNKITILLLLIGFVGMAQEKKWSLQECVSYALENNITIQQTSLNNGVNEQNIKAAKGQFLPSLGANVSQSLSLGNVELFPGSFVDRTFHSTNARVSVSQTIFNGFRTLNSYKQAQLSLEQSNLELNRVKDDISLNVVNNYLNILFNKENLAVAIAQFNFSKKQLEQISELVDAGVQPRGNLLDVEATIANDEQRVIAAENNLILAKLGLTQLLQLPSANFDIVSTEVGSPSELLLYNDSNQIYTVAVENRSEIHAAEKNIEISKLSTEISKGGYLPVLSASYGFNSAANFSNLSGSNPFFEQMNDNKGHNFSLNLSIPIFSRFSNKTSVAKSKIQEEQAQLSLDQAKLTLQSNIERAYTDARAALKTYVSAQKSMVAQKLSFDNASERYNIGAMSSFDLDQTRNKLVNSESSLINAKYDFVFKTKVLDFYAGKSLID